MIKAVQKKLLKWFDSQARALPWRNNRTPYRIWLSEIMLQQTTVVAVIPYYEKFLTHYPTVTVLANTPLEQVLADWAGLGYYARARNLHKCAQVIANDYGGEFPHTSAQLLNLPGIGPYTAAAVAAIAYGEPIIAVDGNVERVVARLFAITEPLAKAKLLLQSTAQQLAHKQRAGDMVEALMELGATICIPKHPQCLLCPVRDDCTAYKLGIQDMLPRKDKAAALPVRQAQVFVVQNKSGDIWCVRRPATGLFGGMLGLPTTTLTKQEANHPLASQKLAWREVGLVTHTFTHFHLELTVMHIIAPKGLKIADGLWLSIDTAQRQLPRLFQKVLHFLVSD